MNKYYNSILLNEMKKKCVSVACAQSAFFKSKLFGMRVVRLNDAYKQKVTRAHTHITLSNLSTRNVYRFCCCYGGSCRTPSKYPPMRYIYCTYTFICFVFYLNWTVKLDERQNSMECMHNIAMWLFHYIYPKNLNWRAQCI